MTKTKPQIMEETSLVLRTNNSIRFETYALEPDPHIGSTKT